MVKKSNTFRYHTSILVSIILLTLSALFLVSPAISAAEQASFMWDPNIEPDIGGYRIYCREPIQPYSDAAASWEGVETEGIVYDLTEGTAYCCVVRAFDTDGFESEDSSEVCFETSGIVNHAPRADAGPDQLVSEGQSVSLNASNSIDDDDGIASYQWVQIVGPEVLLSDPDAAQPIFTAPDIGVEGAALTFELTVTDIAGNQGQDTCVVNVTWQNEPPFANAGHDQTVDEGVLVSLDGSSSADIDDGIVVHEWVQIGYPTVSLSNASTPSPTFTAPPVGPDGLSLTFSLMVTDAGGLQSTDTCVVNITWQNDPPLAVVAPDYLETTQGTQVTLDGSRSMDSDDGIASYKWAQIEGLPVVLSNPASAITTLVAPNGSANDETIRMRLTVTDLGGLKGTADSTVYIMQNEAPALISVAISGPSTVKENSGAQYALTAMYSDGNSTVFTDSADWSQNSSQASIDGNGNLTTGSVAANQAILITASYEGLTDTHQVTIEDIPPTLTSITINGPSLVDENSGAQYVLTANYNDGSSSAVTGVASWSDNTNYASISSNGYLTIGSVASDQSCTLTASYEGKSDTYNVTIEDAPANQPPLAGFSWANSKKIIVFTDQSVDNDGSIVAWHWDFGDGKYSTARYPGHRYAKFGTYTVTLTVQDDGGASASVSKIVSLSRK